MMPARHSFWADWIFQRYLSQLFRRHFHSLHLLGEIPQSHADHPLLLLPNHSTWWDGFFIYLLNKKIFRRRAYLMMLETQLRRYPFFRHLGVFAVDPASPGSVRAAMRSAAQVLQQETPAAPLLCVFPQGELLPWSQRPLHYKRGVALILRTAHRSVNVLPLAMRIEFLDKRLPQAFFLFGESYVAEPGAQIAALQLAQAEEKLLEALASRLRNGERGSILRLNTP